MKYRLLILFFAQSSLYAQVSGGFPPSANPMTGGSTGQFFMKNSNSNNDWAWSTFFGSSSITTVGTIGTGTWQGSVIGSTYGGTGINNAGRTLTINTNSGTIDFTGASKTLSIANSITLSGTDGKGINVGAATSGKFLIGDGSNMILSTPSWPTAAPALGEVPMGDATNFVSTYGGWSYVKTLASDFTVTNAGLTDVTGMSFSVNSGESWFVEIDYACSANNTTGDIIQDLVAAGATFTTTANNAEGVHYSSSAVLTNRAPAAFSSTTSAQGSLVVNEGDNVIRVCRMIYEFTCSAGTTIKLQIGVGTPSGGRTATIYANARMMARRIR